MGGTQTKEEDKNTDLSQTAIHDVRVINEKSTGVHFFEFHFGSFSYGLIVLICGMVLFSVVRWYINRQKKRNTRHAIRDADKAQTTTPVVVPPVTTPMTANTPPPGGIWLSVATLEALYSSHQGHQTLNRLDRNDRFDRFQELPQHNSRYDFRRMNSSSEGRHQQNSDIP